MQKYEDASSSKLLCGKSNTLVHIIAYVFNTQNDISKRIMMLQIILQIGKHFCSKTALFKIFM